MSSASWERARKREKKQAEAGETSLQIRTLSVWVLIQSTRLPSSPRTNVSPYICTSADLRARGERVKKLKQRRRVSPYVRSSVSPPMWRILRARARERLRAGRYTVTERCLSRHRMYVRSPVSPRETKAEGAELSLADTVERQQCIC
jgi:hypothetical protein